MNSAPLLGRAAGRHGSCCGGPPGLDCADYYKGKKPQRALEKRSWQREENVALEFERFDMFEPQDLNIYTYVDSYWTHAEITHLPTGVMVKDRHETSLMIAKRRALRRLKVAIEDFDAELDDLPDNA